ncbi:MAG: hypothetical protein EAZ58_02370 [Flavobacterium sp.]|nr:MAG: hypothetical protein EAZ58_02370 [Flavobacterium sp.]
MSHCCVIYCTNDWRRLNCQSMHFHKFPVNPHTKKRWIVAIRRDEGPDFKVSSSLTVTMYEFVLHFGNMI